MQSRLNYSYEDVVKALEDLDSKTLIQKDGMTGPNLSIGGTITPRAATEYMDRVIDISPFLGMVHNEPVYALEQETDLFDIPPKSLVRVAEGVTPVAGQLTQATNYGKKWALKDQQLFCQVTFNAIMHHQKRGNLEQYLSNMFGKAFSNDLLLLGCIGYEGSGDAFEDLNDGWLELIRDGVSGTDRDMDNTLDGLDVVHTATMSKMLKEMDGKYLYDKNNAFIMSSGNYQLLVDEVGANSGLNQYLINGEVPSWHGYKVIEVPVWPVDTFAFTNPKNLGFGMGMGIQRYRELKGQERCVNYTWTVYADYLVFNDEAMVYSDTA